MTRRPDKEGTFEREFRAVLAKMVHSKFKEKVGLKTPDGEPLHVDDESITDLLKRTGGQ